MTSNLQIRGWNSFIERLMVDLNDVLCFGEAELSSTGPTFLKKPNDYIGEIKNKGF